MEVTSQATAAAPQTSSAAPTNYVPSAASQYATSAPQTSQVSPAQSVAPQVPAYQAPAQAQQVSAPQANPWQQAFQALSASLNTSNPSQAQVTPSAYQTTPTPQATTPQAWGSMATGSPDLQSPSRPGATGTEAANLVQQAAAHGQANASDSYLNGISDASLEVLEHFGAEAPALLTSTHVQLKMH